MKVSLRMKAVLVTIAPTDPPVGYKYSIVPVRTMILGTAGAWPAMRDRITAVFSSILRGTKTPIRHLTSRFTTNPAVVAGVTSTMARDFAGATPYWPDPMRRCEPGRTQWGASLGSPEGYQNPD
jgi:hypothetical protein